MQAVVDNLWVFIAAVLVFFMQAGFALVESGMTRAKNVINIMAKNLADASVGILAFLIVGYALAFGGSGAFWGTEGFFLSGSDLFTAGSSGVGNLSFCHIFPLSGGVCGYGRHDRFRRHGGAHPIQCLPHSQPGDDSPCLSHSRALDVGRWIYRRHRDLRG